MSLQSAIKNSCLIIYFGCLSSIKVLALDKDDIKFGRCQEFTYLQVPLEKNTYQDTAHPTVVDASHYSTVFGEVRNYRIYLPPSYYTIPQKQYPVIYFFHGWSQRYFGPVGVEYSNFDAGDDNGGDNINNYVSRHEVIVVKMDGYDKSRDEKYNVRPYNIGPVEKSFRQFPIYFPELVNHIDGNYKTIPDRNHRAVSGLSMGGFMAFWIAGKYPQMISAVGNFCGSTEFEVGPKDLQVEYKHINMYNNYGGINVRLHYGNKDFIHSYHEDLNRSWVGVMENYSYKEYDAGHSTSGLGDMFDSIMRSFKNPPLIPEKWGHTDVYPDFSVWGYNMFSDRNISGFTVLENVDKNGFKTAVRKFLPDGELLSSVKLTVVTPALYKKNKYYIINDIDLFNGKKAQRKIKSDNSGKLKIDIDGSAHQISINYNNLNANLALQGYKVSNAEWAVADKKINISVNILNKGLGVAHNVKAKISSVNKGISFNKNTFNYGAIKSNGVAKGQEAFEFTIKNDTFDLVRLKLLLTDDKGKSWTEYFEIPVRHQSITNPIYEIADGRNFTVAKSAVDSEYVFLGAGNGDGIANSGESIVILIKDKNLYRRAYLFSSDEFVNTAGENISRSDNWGNFDHGGASAKYSIPVISSGCPDNHTIVFYAEYLVPTAKSNHKVEGCQIEINVQGQDKTTPWVAWANMSANNTFSVKLVDGSPIKAVIAHFTPYFDDVEQYLGPEIINMLKPFSVELNDNGFKGDIYSSDNLFSCKILPSKFCLYKVSIEALDSFGNKSNEKIKENVVLY